MPSPELDAWNALYDACSGLRLDLLWWIRR